MKSVLNLKMFALATVLSAAGVIPAAQAQRGSADFETGSGTIHIEIGSNRGLQDRTTDLERAVRQLQRRVYQLERNGGVRGESWVCTTQSNFDDPFIGHGPTQTEAEFAARQACGKVRSAMMCKNEAHCEPE